MRLVLVALLAVMGCAEERNPDGKPPGNGGGSGGTGTGPDAAPAPDGAGGAAQSVSGFVCHVTDLRDPYECPSVEMGGFTVREQGSTNSTTTGSDGSFTLELATANPTTLEVSGSGKRLTLLPVLPGTSGVLAPLVPTATAAAVVSSLGQTEAVGTGIVVVHLFEGTELAQGARVIATNVQPYYDIASSPFWSAAGPTGSFGASLMINVPVAQGTFNFQATNATVTVNRDVQVPIVSGSITFGAVDVGL